MTTDYKIIKFGAAWCGPCKTQHGEFKNNPPKVGVVEVDIEDDGEVYKFTKEGEDVKSEGIGIQDLVEKYVIKSVPTMVLVDGDLNELRRWCGFTRTAEIDGFIEEMRKGKTA